VRPRSKQHEQDSPGHGNFPSSDHRQTHHRDGQRPHGRAVLCECQRPMPSFPPRPTGAQRFGGV